MEGTDIIELKSRLKLYGMRGLRRGDGDRHKRRHEPPQIVGDLLCAEIAEKKAVTSYAVSTVRARNK